MQLNVVSYNGHTLNDSNYGSWFPQGQPGMPAAPASWAARAQTWPLLSYKEIKGTTLQLHIVTKGTIHSQLDTLKAWFPVLDYVQRALVVADAANIDKQWYVMCYAITDVEMSPDGPGEYIVTLAVNEPLWRSVIASTDTKAVSSSPASKSLTVLGNWPARPIISITLTGAKTGGFAKKWWKPLYNPLTVSNSEPYDWTRGGWDTAALVADTSVSNQINQGGGISAVLLTIPIDTAVGGGLTAGGGMAYVDTEQIYYTSITGSNMIVYDDGAGTTGRGWGGTTAATHADNAVLKKSQVMANGNDIRMFDGRTEIPRHLSGMNTSATKIYIKPTFAPDLTMTQDTAIAGAGSVTTVTVKKTAANLAMLKRLPSLFWFYIGTELFIGSAPVPASYKFTCVGRTQKGTTIAAHASGSTIRVLEHELTMMYGNASADAPVQDETTKPIFDMVNTTNTSVVYADFLSADGLRSGAAKTAISKRVSPNVEGNSRIYSKAQNDLEDPASVLGFAIKSYFATAKWNAETFTGSITFYHPAGFTTVTVTGDKRRETADWPSFIFQKSADGVTWITVFTEVTPVSAAAWIGSLASHSAVALGAGTWKYIRWLANGSIKGAANNAAYLEMTAATFVLTSANVLQAAFATVAENNYYVDQTGSITETGESFTLRGPAAVGDVIVVDCDRETLKVNGGDGNIGITWNTSRGEWLDLPSTSQQATCTFVFTETGAANVDVAFSWENRMLM